MSDYETDLISSSINHIRTSSLSDFVALALPVENGNKYRWSYVSGNTNLRYQQMLVKRGKELSGMAVLLGRSLVKGNGSLEAEKYKLDCPLMLAEGLKTATAIPIALKMGGMAVLLVGLRHVHHYTANELSKLEALARALTL